MGGRRPEKGGVAGAWRRVTYANVMSTLAVVLAVGGGSAIAASKLAKNSVTSATVKNGSLASADLADGKGVSAADAADGSLSGADLGDSSLSGAQLADGSVPGTALAPGAVGSAQLGANAVGKGDLAANAVTGAEVRAGSLTGTDLGTDTITGEDVDEATLTNVPSAAKFNGLEPGAFLKRTLVSRESPVMQGEGFGGGSGFRIRQGCEPSEKLISGGPANVDPGSTVFEDAPVNGVWVVAIRVPAAGVVDNFSVSVICAQVHQ